MGCSTYQRSASFRYVSYAGSGSSLSSCVFSGVFIAEEVYGVGDSALGDTTIVGVQTLVDVFLNMSVTFARFIVEAFSC
jgi:hypothetical protein